VHVDVKTTVNRNITSSYLRGRTKGTSSNNFIISDNPLDLNDITNATKKIKK